MLPNIPFLSRVVYSILFKKKGDGKANYKRILLNNRTIVLLELIMYS